MKNPIANIFYKYLLIISVLFCINNCLYTSHNYNTGKIQKEGHLGTTLGLGSQSIFEYNCDSEGKKDIIYSKLVIEEEKPTCYNHGIDSNYNTSPTPSYSTIPDISYGMNLGIKDKLGVFPGLEMGVLLQAPTAPASLDFYIKLGMPTITNSLFKHAISTGFGMGVWVDNTYFLEYAASFPKGKHLFYGSMRSIILATQINDNELHSYKIRGVEVNQKENPLKNSKRRFVQIINVGYQYKLPEIIVVPDFITPQLNFIFPSYSLSSKGLSYGRSERTFDVKWNVGFGWDF